MLADSPVALIKDPRAETRPESFALPVLGQRPRSAAPDLSSLCADDARLAQLPLRALFAEFRGAARALFMKFHLGGCDCCALPLEASLAQLCAERGLELARAVECVKLSAEFERQSQLSPGELSARLAAGERIRLLDARSDEEWIAARIKGAIHLDDTRVAGILQSWPRDLALVIYCHLGHDAPIAVDYFLTHGFKNVRWLSGGIDAWSREVDPSVRRYRLDYPAPAPAIPPTPSKSLL